LHINEPNDDHWNIVLLTCRPPTTDFRLPLAEELQRLGHSVRYIYLKRRPVVTDMGGSGQRLEFSLVEFFQYMRRTFKGRKPLLFFNSTNLVFPMISRSLRLLCGGIWCFDMHDELFYGKTGLGLLKARIAQRILLGGSDLIVHAAPTLKERFPTSHHLGNASTITAVDRPNADFKKLLVLASIDERFDFAFLKAIAEQNPALTFEIYGQIVKDGVTQAHVASMLTSHGNILYHGAYVNSEIEQILSNYKVTLAPYVAASKFTRYIDPLRYYHCLNSGMEVISTAIPKAEDLKDVLHVVRAPEEVGAIVRGLADGSVARRNDGSAASKYNWRQKSIDLTRIVREYAAKIRN
jgi:hypothetical protein